MAIIKKIQPITSSGKNMEKREPAYAVVGLDIGVATMENSMENPQNITI